MCECVSVCVCVCLCLSDFMTVDSRLPRGKGSVSAFNFVLTIVTQILLLKTSIYFHVVSGSELLETLRFLHILIVQTRTPVSCEFLDSFFTLTMMNWIFFPKAHLGHTFG